MSTNPSTRIRCLASCSLKFSIMFSIQVKMHVDDNSSSSFSFRLLDFLSLQFSNTLLFYIFSRCGTFVHTSSASTTSSLSTNYDLRCLASLLCKAFINHYYGGRTKSRVHHRGVSWHHVDYIFVRTFQ